MDHLGFCFKAFAVGGIEIIVVVFICCIIAYTSCQRATGLYKILIQSYTPQSCCVFLVCCVLGIYLKQAQVYWWNIWKYVSDKPVPSKSLQTWTIYPGILTDYSTFMHLCISFKSHRAMKL